MLKEGSDHKVYNISFFRLHFCDLRLRFPTSYEINVYNPKNEIVGLE